MDYSVVIPVFNEVESIIELTDRIFMVFKSINKENNFEIIFIDDGSFDSTLEILENLSKEKTFVRFISLRKTFGKSYALISGFIKVTGNIVITMDGDLQDRPEDIPLLLEKLNEGYDVVSGWRHDRKDNLIKILGSKLFNSVVSYFGGIKLHDFNCGFKAYNVKVIKHVCIYGQYHRFIPLLAHLLGFKVTEVKISHAPRIFGVSKYPILRYQGFFDLLSILFTYKYKYSPLYFFGKIGLFFIIPSFSILVYLAFKHTLFVLGLGENYMARITLLLPLSTSFFTVGSNIFLTGFVCDFVLSHQSKDSIIDLLESIKKDDKK